VPVAMLVAGPDAAEPIVGPDAAERLSRLGITRVSLLADPSGIGVVMEGWAFDPAHVIEALRIVFPDGPAAIRVFREIEQVAVTMVEPERST
jgi:hypothetical protein